MRDLGGHCEPRILVWRGNPKFFTLSNLLFSFLRLKEARSPPQSLLAMTGKESPRGEGKVLTMAEISQAVVKGAGRKWGVLVKEAIRKEKEKWGEGNFPPPIFLKASHSLSSLKSNLCTTRRASCLLNTSPRANLKINISTSCSNWIRIRISNKKSGIIWCSICTA